MQESNKYHSLLGPKIAEFIQYKQAHGYPYTSSERSLRNLDKMICQNFENSNCLTKEICEAWIYQNRSLHPNGLARKISPIRQFGKFLLNCGIEAYIIPSGIPGKTIKYEPHIYSEAELKAFFRKTDEYPKSPVTPAKHYILPVIFRLLYTCGLRQAEARRLELSDVDLNTGKIIIRESKGWSKRIIYVHPEMLEQLILYRSHVSQIYPDSKMFFPNQCGSTISATTLNTWFHEIWDSLPEALAVTGNNPRIHDFRHTYCVYRLNEWARNNEDVSSLYVFLSEFVGHTGFHETDYYLTLAECYYPDLRNKMQKVNSTILPEVISDEY